MEKMESKIYPAVFHKAEVGYWVEFPDVAGCFTQGETLEEAFRMAKEALALGLDGVENVVATPIEDIAVADGDRVLLVEADNADDIEYFKTSEVPKMIENGLADKGYTKYQVAQILGVDRAYITKIAKGASTPAPEMAKRIGLLLGFDWKVFYATEQQ